MVRRCFLWLMALTILGFGISEVNAAPPKPMVVVFAAGQDVGTGIIANNQGELSPADRNLIAAKAVRDRLEDNDAVSGVVYNANSPLFLRALQEAGIKLGTRTELTPNERVAIAKAAGAVYIVVISEQPVTGADGFWDMILLGTDVANGKTYTDKSRYQPSSEVLPQPESTDPNAIKAKPQTIPSTGSGPAALATAANTLVMRLLAGPLGEYGRPSPPAELLPPPLKVNSPVIENDSEVINGAYQQSKQLIEQGDPTSAIVLLRKTVSRAPLDTGLRLLLTRAYIAANRGSEAASEARRLMLIAPPTTPTARTETNALLAKAFTLSGDTAAAQSTYQQIIAATPNSKEVNWARLAMAEVYMGQGQTDAATDQYRAILKTDVGNSEAAVGLAKILAEKGDFVAALAEIAPQSPDGTPASPSARHAAAVVLFEVAAPNLARLMKDNRTAWEAKQISREVFYNATKAQSGRAAALFAMVKSAAPDGGKDSPEAKTHARRVLAASLLSQAGTALMEFLESNDQDASSQATLCLLEFEREFTGLKK